MPVTARVVVQWTVAMLAIGLTALALIVLATLWLNARAQIQLDVAVKAIELRQSAESLRSALLAATASQRGYVLTGNEIYLSPYDTAYVQALGALRDIEKALGADPDRAPLLQDLSRVVTGLLGELRQTIDLKSARRDQEVLAIVNSNIGKALMDEANVYLNGIGLDADDRVAAGIRDQSSNTNWLRSISLLGALMIAIVAAVIGVVVRRYAADILAARNAIAAANESLERRVAERTAELSRAKTRAEILLEEVNHRVSNSLAMASSLIRMQARGIESATAKRALEQTDARIQAIAQMHRLLFTSGEIGEVALDQYLDVVMRHLADTLGAERHAVSLVWSLEPVKFNSADAISCGIVATEWVTNAFKYAYPEGAGEIRVRLAAEGGAVVLTVEDDGVGRAENAPAKGTGIGTKVVKAVAGQMNAVVEYADRNPGLSARLTLTPQGPVHG